MIHAFQQSGGFPDGVGEREEREHAQECCTDGIQRIGAPGSRESGRRKIG